jgi:cyclohexanecarboxylate-CoA ligase
MNAIGESVDLMASAVSAEDATRHQHYRERRWWSGEPLLARYLRLSSIRPDDLAVADSRGRKLTHRQLLLAAIRYARELSSAGVTPGDVVLMAMPNCVEWQIVLLAIFYLDAIPATIPVRNDTKNFLHVVELTGARAFVVPEGKARNGLEDIAVAVANQCSHALDVILVSEDGELRHRSAAAKSRPNKPGQRALDCIAFTSSTTGQPKAVMHSNDTIGALNLAFTERFNLGPSAPIFMASPLGHSVGTFHGSRLSLFSAAPLILLEHWDPDIAFAMIQEFRCTFTGAATPYLSDLINAVSPKNGSKLETLRWFLCGGAQVPPSLMDRASEEFPKTKVTVLWGMTEGGLTTCTVGSSREQFCTTCGIGLPGLEIHTVDEAGNVLAPNNEGELVMRGPGVFIGYLGQPKLYQSSLTENKYFRTGDLAKVDGDGYLQITGRVKDLIIRGGVNISPVPIEDALSAHPNVASVAVIGSPDERMGELLCAVIEPRGRRVELAELQQFIRERGLPKYLAPESIRFVDAMPRTPSGKIRKVDLRPLVSGEKTK